MCAPSAPDYSQQIDKQNQLTDRQMDLADRAYTDQKALADKFLPMFEKQAQLNMDAQAQSNQRSDAMWQSYTDTFQPMEKAFAETAANYDTEGRRTQAAQDAAAGVAKNFDIADQQRAEAMAAGGMIPGSGAGLALSNASAIEKAKATAAAENQARDQVEATGLSLKNAAIGIGRGSVSGGLQAADLALRQGGASQGAAGGGMSIAGQPYNTSSGILGAASSANMGAGSLMNSQYQNQLSSAQSNQALFGDALGAGLTAYGMGMFKSSKKLKRMGKKVSDGEVLSLLDASPAHRWNYKPGLGDGNTKARIGPTAESLKGTPVSDGHQIDAISMLGLHHAGLRAVDKKIDKLAARVLKLSDAKASNDYKMPRRTLALANAKRGD